MGPKPSVPISNDQFRQRLDELVNPRHPLAQLAQHIDWSGFEREWAGFFPSKRLSRWRDALRQLTKNGTMDGFSSNFTRNVGLEP